MNHRELLWGALVNTNEWVRFSDTKATLILGVYGAVSAFAFPSLIEHMDLIKKHGDLFGILLIATMISISSIIFSIWCLAPTLKLGKKNEKKPSVFYFKSISDNFQDFNDYFKIASKTFDDNDEIERQIAQQVWANSKVAARKYKAIGWSIWLLVGSVTMGILFIVLGLAYSLNV